MIETLNTAHLRLQAELPDNPMFDLDEWMIGWNSNFYGKEPGSVEVGPWPDTTGWSERYQLSSGCCYSSWRGLTREQKLQDIVNGFFVLVLGHGLGPAAVHREFWKIREYRTLNMSFLGHGKYRVFQGKGRCDPYNP